MIKGKFSRLAVVLHLFLLVIPVMAFWQGSKLINSGEIEADSLIFYMIAAVFVLFTIYAVVSPILNIKEVYIDDKIFIYKYLFFRKSYTLNEIDGYFTMEVPSKDTTYETIYPVMRNRILPPVSSFYISNYDDLKNSFPLKHIGRVKFSWKNYFIILFVSKYNELDR